MFARTTPEFVPGWLYQSHESSPVLLHVETCSIRYCVCTPRKETADRRGEIEGKELDFAMRKRPFGDSYLLGSVRHLASVPDIGL